MNQSEIENKDNERIIYINQGLIPLDNCRESGDKSDNI